MGNADLMNEFVQQFSAVCAVEEAELHPADVWLGYLAAGGFHDELEIDGYLRGLIRLDLGERNLLADAVNELLDDEAAFSARAAYSTDAVEGGPSIGQLEGPAWEAEAEAEFYRCHAVFESGLLESATEARFDHITRQVRERFAARSALFAVITEDRQVIKSVAGSARGDLPRWKALCYYTVRADRTLVIEDAAGDPFFAEHPLVAGGVRFYAGHPIRDADGWRIGTLCLLDERPRAFSEDDERDLRLLAARLEHEVRACSGRWRL